MSIKEEDLAKLEKSTLKIAKKKIVPSIILGSEGQPLMRMGTGGRFDNFFFLGYCLHGNMGTLLS